MSKKPFSRIEKAMVIREEVGRSYILMVYGIIKYVNEARNSEWEVKELKIKQYRQRIIEEFQIKVIYNGPRGNQIEYETYYFDITDVINQLRWKDPEFDLGMGHIEVLRIFLKGKKTENSVDGLFGEKEDDGDGTLLSLTAQDVANSINN
jgi:hypothetical protein